jgi:hypothetical protein
MGQPIFRVGRNLGCTDQLITGRAQEVPSRLVLERPLAFIGHMDLEQRARLFLVCLTSNIAKAVHGQVFAKMGA